MAEVGGFPQRVETSTISGFPDIVWPILGNVLLIELKVSPDGKNALLEPTQVAWHTRCFRHSKVRPLVFTWVSGESCIYVNTLKTVSPKCFRPDGLYRLNLLQNLICKVYKPFSFHDIVSLLLEATKS